MRVLEILHVIADDDRLAMRRRLENVMPAVSDETAADIDHVADRIHLAEFADRVENYDVFIVRRTLLQFRSARDREARLLTDMNDFHRAQEFARRNHQSGARMIFSDLLKRVDGVSFLIAMRAARNQNPLGVRQAHVLQDFRLLLGSHVGISLIEFRIPRYDHQIIGGAQLFDIIGVDG